MTDQYDFHIVVTDMDPEGYYYTRWDKATPLVIRATNRSEAFTKAWAVMGECRRGRTWTGRIKRIESAHGEVSA
jgi:hypothetical protein